MEITKKIKQYEDKQYSQTGELLSRCFYVDDILNGPAEFYYKNGLSE